MNNNKGYRYKYYFLILAILGSVAFTSCHRYRYKRMIKKRRVMHHKKSRHKSRYQKRLNKKAVSTGSTYYIKSQRNYRRRPWYDK
jgi:hypothetical protein